MGGCLLIVFAVFAPRLILFFICLLTDWIGQAYETNMWPLLGWFFLPYTTLAYMGAMLNNDREVSGGWLVLMIIAILFDLGGSSSVSETRRR